MVNGHFQNPGHCAKPHFMAATIRASGTHQNQASHFSSVVNGRFFILSPDHHLLNEDIVLVHDLRHQLDHLVKMPGIIRALFLKVVDLPIVDGNAVPNWFHNFRHVQSPDNQADEKRDGRKHKPDYPLVRLHPPSVAL